MSFAFSNIILNRAAFTYTSGRATLNGSGLAFDSETVKKNDSVGQESIDSANRYLKSSLGAIAVDWEEGYITDYSGTLSLSQANRVLYDSNELSSVDWASRDLYNSGGSAVLNWNDGTIYGLGGSGSIYWNDRYLVGTQGLAVVDWDTCALFDRGGNGKLSWEYSSLLQSYGGGFPVTTLDWSGLLLSGGWSCQTPTGNQHIANKAYVDSVAGASSGVYTLQFAHSQLSPAGGSTYYIGGPLGNTPTTSQSTSPVVVVPTSGVLRKVIGNASVPGTLGSSGVVSMVVYKNGSSVATGSYLATGRNNPIVSGLSGLNVPIGYLDTLQLGMSCPPWSTPPTNLSNSLVAYISLA